MCNEIIITPKLVYNHWNTWQNISRPKLRISASSELSQRSFSDGKPIISHRSAFPRILHAVFFAYLNTKPANMIQCKSNSCFLRTFFKGHSFRRSLLRIVLQAKLHILHAVARGFHEFTADVASFKYSVDYCTLILLYVFIILWK